MDHYPLGCKLNSVLHSGLGLLLPDLDVVDLLDEVIMTEQGRGLGELGHQLQPLVAGSTVVELHLVCQAPGLAAALKCAMF